jgi:hypothetical protein
MEVWNFVVYNFFIWQCFTAFKRDCWFCKGTMLAGDIRHPPAKMLPFVLAGALCRLPVLCICAGGWHKRPPALCPHHYASGWQLHVPAIYFSCVSTNRFWPSECGGRNCACEICVSVKMWVLVFMWNRYASFFLLILLIVTCVLWILHSVVANLVTCVVNMKKMRLFSCDCGMYSCGMILIWDACSYVRVL